MKQQTEVIIKDLDKLIQHFTENNESLTSGQVALIGAGIGAGSAILAQLIIFILNNRKDNKKKKQALIADERSLAFLITRYYRQYSSFLIDSDYWYQVSKIYKGTQDEEPSYQKTFEYKQKARDTLIQIDLKIAEYFKIVTHYTNITGENIVINLELEKIKTFVPKKSSEFSEILDYYKLREEAGEEEKRIHQTYEYFANCFNAINIEMKKK